ncbi:MAG: hypothetical protein OEO82_13910 [Gammaproteobacteria bacterium]|nr:hypothetical protein [Gammaproteobacteria bacterium]
MNPVRRKTNRASRLSVLLLLAAGSAHAHIPLTPAILNDAFEELERAQAAADRETDKAGKAAAIYGFALKATDLMTLLNQEIQLHGKEQQELLDQAVAVAAGLGIDITWSEDHQRYFYTGNAYRQYLELVPDGLNAANSRYHLIETGFYRGDAANREELDTRAAMESDFLRRYPEYGNAGRVAMFLAIDYRDLWRLCQATKDQECAARYAQLNREHLVAIADRYADGKTGEMARTLLQRFEAEIADSR